MKLLITLWQWVLRNISPQCTSKPSLLTDIENSFNEWQSYKDMFNYADPELTDYMIYRLNAAERHYMFLLSEAKSQGLKSWPDSIKDPVK